MNGARGADAGGRIGVPPPHTSVSTSPASRSQQPAQAHSSKITSPRPPHPRLPAPADAALPVAAAQRQPAERAHPAQHAPAHHARGAPMLGVCCRDTPGEAEAEGGARVGGGECLEAVGEGEYWSGGGGGGGRRARGEASHGVSRAIGGAVPSPPLRGPTRADAVRRLYRRYCTSCDVSLAVVSCVGERFEVVKRGCVLVTSSAVGGGTR